MTCRAEHLEPRRHLTVTAAVTDGILHVVGDQSDEAILVRAVVGGHVLTVRGTDSDDSILIEQASDGAITVTLNQTSTTYPAGFASMVVVDGLAGDDLISNLTNLPSSLLGGRGGDTITGGSAPDWIDPSWGANEVFVGIADLIEYASLPPSSFHVSGVDGGGIVGLNLPSDNDVNIFSYDVSTGIAIRLTPGEDLVHGELTKRVTILGGSGDDRMFAYQNPFDGEPPFECRIDGEAGNDTLRGEYYEDALAPDSVWGGDGDDVFYGTGTNDKLDGGAGVDLQTEPGTLFHPGPSLNYTFRVGRNIEILTMAIFPTYGLRVFANDGGCMIAVSAGRVTVTGGAGNDTIRTGDSNDVILGGGGNDIIRAGGGSDSVRGEVGNDLLIADADTDIDTLDGGEGIDRVVALPAAPTPRGKVFRGGGDILISIERTLTAAQCRIDLSLLFPEPSASKLVDLASGPGRPESLD